MAEHEVVGGQRLCRRSHGKSHARRKHHRRHEVEQRLHPWCFPLVVVVASAIGFGFATYYWGRNARIENYLRRRKEEADRTLRQNQPN